MLKKSLLHYFLAGAYFLAMTLLITYPLVLHFRNSIVGGNGDGVYFIWLIRWYERVIFDGQGAPFFNAMMNYPEGWNLSTTDTALASALPGAPFSRWLGPIAGFNIAMWITFVLSGLAMYIWVYRHTQSRAAGLISGTIFAFLPYRIAHFDAGHLNLSGTAWIPLYFLGLYEILCTKKKWNWGWMLTCALSLGLIGLSSMYYLYFTIIISAVFVLGFLLFDNWRVLWQPAFWLRTMVTGLFSAPLLYVALKPFLSLSGQGGLADRSLEYANLYSASPTDFFTHASNHFLLGRWISGILDRSLWIESSLYIGLVTLILIVLAFIWRGKTDRQTMLYIAVLIMAVAFVLALGPNLHWNNRIIEISIPWLGVENTAIPLPTLLLFKYLPFYAKMRAVMRVGFFVLTFAAFAAGLGSAALLKRVSPRWRAWAAVAVIGLALLDFMPGSFRNAIQPVPSRPVDAWLASQPGMGAVIQMPFIHSIDQEQVYFTLAHGKPITGGFFNANQPPQFLYLAPILDSFPDEKSVQTLREYRVEYILINPSDYANFPSLELQLSELGLELRSEQGGIQVYGFSDAQ